MPYYKDINNGMRFLDSATQELDDGVIFDNTTLLPSGCILITDAEAKAIIAENEKAQAAIIAALPNSAGFAQAIKSDLGGILAVNAISAAYPLFFDAIATQQWSDVKALVLDAQSKNVINTTQYAAIKSAALSFNIPLELV